MNQEQLTQEPIRNPGRFSMGTKLVQAAALAAVLVPLGTLPAEAAPISTITCGFGGAGFSGGVPAPGFNCVPSDPSVPGGEGYFSGAVFNWGPYALTLDFLDVRGPFFIAVTNEEISQTAMALSLRLAAFPNDVCVPISDVADTCVVFHFSGNTEPSDTTWRGDWIARINWLADTNLGYPGPTVRVRHARGDDQPFNNGLLVFDTDITVPGSYCPFDCSFDAEGLKPLFPPGTDPEIAGTDNNFRSIIVTSEVPEPTTMLLLGTGLIGLWYRRRRARLGR